MLSTTDSGYTSSTESVKISYFFFKLCFIFPYLTEKSWKNKSVFWMKNIGVYSEGAH